MNRGWWVRLLPTAGDLRHMGRHPGRNLVAGLTVAIVALPLALGFGAASGLGPEAGMVTAIVAGTLAALFGGSNLQVSGPTGAMTVVLVPIVHSHGVDGVLMVGLIAGVMLVVLGASGAGAVVRYVPAPVVEGFTLGIAAVIFLQQLPPALGVPAHGERVLQVAWNAVTQTPQTASLLLALGVAGTMLVVMHWRPGLPVSIVAVAAATLVAEWGGLDVARIGELPATLPAPSLGFVDLGAMPGLVTAAIAVAALAALESLLSATVADGMTVGQQHDPDRELFGQGLANIVTPMFGGVPATAAIARTAVNVRSGASSRLAALTHAVVLGAVMLVAAGLVAAIPLAALAGVLAATALRMVEVSALATLARASRGEAAVLALTAGATLALDLVVAVILGLVIAGALALRQVAQAAQVQAVPLDRADHEDEEHALLAQHIVAYRLDGPLFFAAAHRFLMELTAVGDVRVVVLRLGRITTIDATGALVLRDVVRHLEQRGVVVMASGVRPEHHRALGAIGVLDHLRDAGRLFDSTPQAIAAARDELRARGLMPPDPGRSRDAPGVGR